MTCLNHCQFIGNIGNAPEIRYTQGGDAVVSFSLACNETWKDKSGEKKESLVWVRCSAWKRLAETIGEYCEKGKQIYVSGKLQNRSWEDKNGNKRITTEILVDRMLLLGKKKPTEDDTPPF